MDKTIYSDLSLAFCQQVKQWRGEKGLTQRELASLLDREQALVGRIEVGERRVDIVEIFFLMKALGIDARQGTTKLMDLFYSITEQKTEKDHRVSLKVIESIARKLDKCRSWRSLIKTTLAEIEALKIGDYVTWSELSPEGTILNAFDSQPIEEDMSKAIAKINEHLEDNPLIKLFQMTKMDYTFRQFADFAEYSFFHETPLYKEIYKASGIHNQLGGGVYFSDTRSIVISINNGEGQPFFSDAEKLIMTYLRPIIARACARLDPDKSNVNELQFHQSELLKYSQVLQISKKNEIVNANDSSKKFLEHHFDWSKQQTLIPASLSKGLKRLSIFLSKNKEKTPVGWLPSEQKDTIVGYYLQNSPYSKEGVKYLYLWAVDMDIDQRLPKMEQQALMELARGLSIVQLADKLALNKQELKNLLYKLNTSLENTGDSGSFLDKLNYQSFRQLCS